MTDVCDRCGFKPKEGCVNGFMVDDGANMARLCRNLTVKNHMEASKERIGPEIFDAEKITTSPLYVPREKADSLSPPSVDLTSKNLHIQGVSWNGFKPHLRLVLLCKPRLTFKVVSDVRLKDVYLGGESAKNRSGREKELKENNNIISDIVGKDYDLVIVQLGLMGYKNISAPGVLKEALMHRVEILGKPTWLFETADPTITWRHSRDEDVAYYISQKFRVVELESSDQTPDREGFDDDFDAEPATEQFGTVQQRPDQQESDTEDSFLLPGPLPRLRQKPPIPQAYKPSPGGISKELADLTMPGEGEKKWKKKRGF